MTTVGTETRCAGCGQCCRVLAIPVECSDVGVPHEMTVNSDDVLDADLYMARDERTGHCIALTEDGLCSIYPDRPEACRDFEPGCELCQAVLAEREA